MVYHRILNIIPCAIQQDLVVYPSYIKQLTSANPKSFPPPILFFFLKLINLFIHLLLFLGAVLGLHCCMGAFSSCSERGLLFRCSAQASHCSGFSCCGSRALGTRASVVVAHGLQQLWLTDLVAPQHVGSSRTGDQTHVPFIGRQILNHCTTREVPSYFSTLECIQHMYLYQFAKKHEKDCVLHCCLHF